MSRKYWFLTLLLLIAAGAVLAQEAETTPDPRAQYRGPSRDYVSYVPTWYEQGDGPLPLVIVLHGSGGNGVSAAQTTGFHEFAERDGFIVFYPDGLGRRWNDGLYEDEEIVDDVAFLLNVINQLSAAGIVDPNYVFVAGFSNGGSLAYRLACEAPDYFKGIAAVSASLGLYARERCIEDAGGVSVLVMHGTEDSLIYIHRGMRDVNTGETITFAPRAAAQFWATYNGCGGAPERETLPDADDVPETFVRRTLYTVCATDAQVAYYEIVGGGHSWPGQRVPLSRDPATNDIDASEVIWDFFVVTSGYQPHQSAGEE